MRKRKYRILAAMLIVIVMLFVSNNALAFNDYCDSPAESMTIGDYTVKLTSIIETEAGSGLYDWKYEMTNKNGKLTGVNFIAMLIPDCCNDAIVFDPNNSVPIAADWQVFDVGQGEQVKGFGQGNYQAYVIKSTPVVAWTLRLDTNVKTETTIYLETSGGPLYFPMVGPGCMVPPPPPPLGGRTFSECANFGQDTVEPIVIDEVTLPATADDVSFYMVRSSTTEGCITTIWACEGLDCPQCADQTCPTGETSSCVEIFGENLPDEYVLQGSFLRSCPDENVSISQSSPYYLYKFYSGGVLYKKCLDLGTGQWTSLSYCGVY